MMARRAWYYNKYVNNVTVLIGNIIMHNYYCYVIYIYMYVGT